MCSSPTCKPPTKRSSPALNERGEVRLPGSAWMMASVITSAGPCRSGYAVRFASTTMVAPSARATVQVRSESTSQVAPPADHPTRDSNRRRPASPRSQPDPRPEGARLADR